MRNFGTFMPAMGMRVRAKTPATQAIAQKVLALFKEFHQIATEAKAVEDRILRMEEGNREVPESTYREYEGLLQQAVDAHEAYAAARQELRDLRSEERTSRQSSRRPDMGCA